MIYNYLCDKCGKEYSESRLKTETQWHTICECGGTYQAKDEA